MYDDFDASNRTMGVPPRTRDGVVAWVDSLVEHGWNLVALAEERVVGHVGVAPAPSPEPQFVVFVDGDYHGRGIGTELVEQLVAYAADGEYDAVELSVSPNNARALRVYRNVGFELANAGPMQLDMRLPLSRSVAERVRRPPAERRVSDGRDDAE